MATTLLAKLRSLLRGAWLIPALALAWTLSAATAPAHADPAKPLKYSSTGAFAWAAQPANENTVLSWDGVVADPATGLPKVVYADGVAHWNPTTVALWGLQEFNRFIVHGRRKSLRAARKAGDWLLTHQPRHGAWRYSMRFTLVRFAPIPPGWFAAQAQGNAISLLVRLYAATDERRYLRAAVRARLPYQRSVADRGVRRKFKGRALLEGFPTAVPSFALEDFQLAVLGLYDLSHFDRTAARLFRTYMDALVWSVPYYEGADGRPQFDLGHRTAGVAPLYIPEAHTFNAQMLGLLGKLAGNAAARRAAARWAGLSTATSVPG